MGISKTKTLLNIKQRYSQSRQLLSYRLFPKCCWQECPPDTVAASSSHSQPMDTFLSHRNCTNLSQGMAKNHEVGGFVNSAVNSFAIHIKASAFPKHIPLFFMVCFHCPTPMLIPIPILRRKAPLEPIPMVILMQSYYENYFKNHLISTNISVKLLTAPICIRIGIRIGSVETVLHIIIFVI